jgi:hypothetical protein
MVTSGTRVDEGSCDIDERWLEEKKVEMFAIVQKDARVD